MAKDAKKQHPANEVLTFCLVLDFGNGIFKCIYEITRQFSVVTRENGLFRVVCRILFFSKGLCCFSSMDFLGGPINRWYRE